MSERLRRLRRRAPARARRAYRRVRAAVRPPAAPPPPARADWDPEARPPATGALDLTPVSDGLAARLDKADRAEVRARLDAEQARILERAQPWARSALTLAFGVHHRVPAVLQKTGLSPADPPGDVHAMGRGALAAGGAYYYADLVVGSLAAVGVELREGMAGLDFGCSSGRVVRVLAAARPDVAWSGCDPNAGAIAWAREHLTGVDFAVGPQWPPTAYADGAFDLTFAISIWSHFGARAAVAWLEEMRRIVRPGGHLVLTTHGPSSIAHYARNEIRSRGQLEEIADRLYAEGFWYAPEFGDRGDHGVVDPEWGTAFFSPEWLLAHATPRWSVRHFLAGRAEGNQDVYVLERTSQV